MLGFNIDIIKVSHGLTGELSKTEQNPVKYVDIKYKLNVL